MKVAIVKLYINSRYYDHYSDNEVISQHITEWKEISDDEFAELQNAVNWLNGNSRKKDNIAYMLVGQLRDKQFDDFSSATLDGYRNHVAQQRAAREKEEAEQQERERIRKEKLEAKRLAKKDAAVKALHDEIEMLKKQKAAAEAAASRGKKSILGLS